MKVPFQMHNIYRLWLVKTHVSQYGGPLTLDQLPISKDINNVAPKLQPRHDLPYPSGSCWREAISQVVNAQGAEIMEAVNASIRDASIYSVMCDLRRFKTKEERKSLHFSIDKESAVMHTTNRLALPGPRYLVVPCLGLPRGLGT